LEAFTLKRRRNFYEFLCDVQKAGNPSAPGLLWKGIGKEEGRAEKSSFLSYIEQLLKESLSLVGIIFPVAFQRWK
jgi:hypothetical protein